jgi:2-methylcitrate dehydratase
LKRRNGLAAENVEHVRGDVFLGAYELAGGGSYGSKDHPQIKEQGDYNLKYLVSAALLDNQVGPARLQTARIQAPNSQAMVVRIGVRPDADFTARYPQELCSHHHSHQRPASPGEGTHWVRGRFGQPRVLPDQSEAIVCVD